MPRMPTRYGTDLAIKALKPKPNQRYPSKHSIAGEPRGLYVQVSPSGTKTWLLRVTVGTRPSSTGRKVQVRRELGLGSYPRVGLQAAREKALEFLAMLDHGIDPPTQRLQAKTSMLEALAKRRTFAHLELETIDAKGPGYKDPVGSIASWRTRMDTHVLPLIGNREIKDLTIEDVATVIRPLWRTKYPTARKTLHDLSAVFRYAKAMKIYEGENPAKVELLSPLLGKPSHRKRHFPSLPFNEVPKFISELRTREGDSARALEFLILTASRSDEVRSAPWSEFDLDKAIWEIPAARMKRDRRHKVPLAARAVEILLVQKSLGRKSPFTNTHGEPLTDAAISGLIKKMHEKSVSMGGAGYLDPAYEKIAVPHGFRSSFKDWARTQASFPDEVSELALAHVNSDATRAAYARDELVTLRRDQISQWAAFCGAATTPK